MLSSVTGIMAVSGRKEDKMNEGARNTHSRLLGICFAEALCATDGELENCQPAERQALA